MTQMLPSDGWTVQYRDGRVIATKRVPKPVTTTTVQVSLMANQLTLTTQDTTFYYAYEQRVKGSPSLHQYKQVATADSTHLSYGRKRCDG